MLLEKIVLLVLSLIMVLFVDVLEFNDLLIKLLSNVLVIILNYIFSKFLVFKSK